MEITDRISVKANYTIPNVENAIKADQIQAQRAVERDNDRRNLALIFTWMYLALLTFAFLLPIILYWINHSNDSHPLTVVEIKDILQAYSGSLGGLTGILGFVVGHYFKSEDRDLFEDTSKKRKR
jgi:hypothetical protein